MHDPVKNTTRFPARVDTTIGRMLSYHDRFAMTVHEERWAMKKEYGAFKGLGVLACLALVVLLASIRVKLYLVPANGLFEWQKDAWA